MCIVFAMCFILVDDFMTTNTTYSNPMDLLSICGSTKTLNPPFDDANPDSKVHGANMGPIWGRQDPGGPHVGPMNFAIWEVMHFRTWESIKPRGIWNVSKGILVIEPFSCQIFLRKHKSVFTSRIISCHWNVDSYWNSLTRKTIIAILKMIDTMAVDDQATQEIRVTTAVILNVLSWNNRVSAP